MRGTQDSAMMDTCQRLPYAAGAADAYGNPGSSSWSAGATLSCGFKPFSRKEEMDGTQVVIVDAEMRLPIATVLDNRDRLKLTKRHGATISPQPVYEIIGEAERGPSGLVLRLRLVTDGSG
jgi:hypothetical protein